MLSRSGGLSCKEPSLSPPRSTLCCSFCPWTQSYPEGSVDRYSGLEWSLGEFIWGWGSRWDRGYPGTSSVSRSKVGLRLTVEHWLESSLGLFHKMVQKDPNELFAKPDRWPNPKPRSPVLACASSLGLDWSVRREHGGTCCLFLWLHPHPHTPAHPQGQRLSLIHLCIPKT